MAIVNTECDYVNICASYIVDAQEIWNVDFCFCSINAIFRAISVKIIFYSAEVRGASTPGWWMRWELGVNIPCFFEPHESVPYCAAWAKALPLSEPLSFIVRWGNWTRWCLHFFLSQIIIKGSAWVGKSAVLLQLIAKWKTKACKRFSKVALIPFTTSLAFVMHTYRKSGLPCLLAYLIITATQHSQSIDVSTLVKIPQLLSATASALSSKVLDLWWIKLEYHYLHPHQHSPSPSNFRPWFQSLKQSHHN